MNKPLVLALILITLTALCLTVIDPVWAIPENSWVSKAPMHEARGCLGVAIVNDKIYAIGGSSGAMGGLIGEFLLTGAGPILNTTEEYDPAMDTWTFKAPMPTPREHFGIAVYENKIYCIGGMAPNGNGISGANEPITQQQTPGKTRQPCLPRDVSKWQTLSKAKST